MEFTNELLAKVKQAKSVEELLALAKENGMGMSEEEAEKLFDLYHKEGELSAEELENVTGGCGDEGGYETNLWRGDNTYFWNHVGMKSVTEGVKYGFTADNDKGWIVGKVTQVKTYLLLPYAYHVYVHAASSYYANHIGTNYTMEGNAWTAYLNTKDKNGKVLCPYND